MTVAARWWRNDEWTPERGAHNVEALDALWAPVACGEHSVQIELDDSTHDRRGKGYQPDCPTCQHAANAVREHVVQVERNMP